MNRIAHIDGRRYGQWYKRHLELVSVILEEFGEAVQAANNYFWKNEGSCEEIWQEFLDIRSPLDEMIRYWETRAAGETRQEDP